MNLRNLLIWIVSLSAMTIYVAFMIPLGLSRSLFPEEFAWIILLGAIISFLIMVPVAFKLSSET